MLFLTKKDANGHHTSYNTNKRCMKFKVTADQEVFMLTQSHDTFSKFRNTQFHFQMIQNVLMCHYVALVHWATLLPFQTDHHRDRT